MVRKGGPSRGCAVCRQRKTKVRELLTPVEMGRGGFKEQELETREETGTYTSKRSAI